MKITEEDINKFHTFELQNNLDKIKYKNNSIWPILRYAVFHYALSSHYVYKKNIKPYSKYKLLIDTCLSIASFRFFFNRSDFILFDYGRNIDINGEKFNPTTFTFIKSLSTKYSITIIDLYGSVNKKSYPGIPVIDISKFLRIFRVSSIFFKRKDWDDCIQKIESYILKDYDKKVNLESIYSNVYIHQYSIKFFIQLIFKFKKPKAIIYSDNASFSATINYARKNNVATIDYQHSLISKFNILYAHQISFVETYKNYLSEYIMSWGPYWTKYYDQNYKVLTVGNLQQELSYQLIKGVQKEKNFITIVSGIISRKVLIEIALFISEAIPELKIYYKLRSEEYPNWRNYYPKEIIDRINITFIDHEHHSLHYYLKKSEYVIGINSTVLIEAIPLSKVIVFRHGWSVEMNDILIAGLALEAIRYDDIVRIIVNNESPNKATLEQNLFVSNVNDNIRSEIKKIT